MLKRLLTTSAALVVVAACGDTPVEAPLDRVDPVAAFAKLDQIEICHLDADLGTYSSIMVNGNAESAHRGHGDGQVGDEVPGMEGFAFGEGCVPQPILANPSACFAFVIDAYEAQYGPWSWSDNGPWSVGVEQFGRIRIVGAGFAGAEIRDFGGGLQYCEVGDRGGQGTSTGFEQQFNDDLSEVRAFLLSKTNGS